MILGWLKFNQSADAAVQSADQETVDSKKADTVVSNLGAISNRSLATQALYYYGIIKMIYFEFKILFFAVRLLKKI